MDIILALAGLFLILSIHEVGHAVRAMRHGITIEECGLGWRLPHVPHLRISLGANRPIFYLNPFLIGAYVSLGDKGNAKLKMLPKEDQASIYAGGIFYNAVSGFMFIMIGAAIYCLSIIGKPTPPPPPPHEWTSQETLILISAGGIAALVILAWMKARWVFGALLVSVGAYIAVINTGHTYIGIGGLLESFVGMTSSLHSYFIHLGIVSLAIAMVNFIPVPPMDGWRLEVLRRPIAVTAPVTNEEKTTNFERVLLVGFFFEIVYGFLHDIALFIARLVQTSH